jgi:hypothetical protein
VHALSHAKPATPPGSPPGPVPPRACLCHRPATLHLAALRGRAAPSLVPPVVRRRPFCRSSETVGPRHGVRAYAAVVPVGVRAISPPVKPYTIAERPWRFER